MIHGSTKALHTKSLYKAQSTRILGLPNEAGETLTGTQKHGHIVHPVQKSFEPTVPTRDNRGPSLILIGCRASLRCTCAWFERICGMEEHNNV